MTDVEIALEDRPGALAQVGEILGGAGVGLEYSDHANRKIFVVDDLERGRDVAAAWAAC